jgi:4-aminobutyrate aminotransferase
MSNDLLQNLSPVWSRITNIVVDHGDGAFLYDADGRRYLDFTCGIGVTNTGHCHPKVVAAIQTQAAKLIHGQINIVYHQPALDLIAELLPLMPPGLDNFFFSNSGAEAIEGAVKLCKCATGKSNVIVFSGSFHGRTHLAMTMTTSKTSYRALPTAGSRNFRCAISVCFFIRHGRRSRDRFLHSRIKETIQDANDPGRNCLHRHRASIG